MARSISIHIGLNEVDPQHYGSPMRLRGCENDARDMATIARAAPFERVTELLGPRATAGAVRQALSEAAGQLEPGGILLVTFSGHGSFVKDPDDQEVDRIDETWCLFDREMIDDELYGLWKEFKAVRILLVSDSCHSGTVGKRFGARARPASHPDAGEAFGPDASSDDQPAFRSIPENEAREIFRKHKQLYRELQDRFRDSRQGEVSACVLLLSACQDWELTPDGERNGLFTAALRSVWDDGRFAGRDYLDFHKDIARKVREAGTAQHPGYYKVGTPNPDFERQRPFEI